MCQDPEGCLSLATELDHIVNVAAGGAMWDEENLRPLCKPHHDAKTQREAQAARWGPRSDD